MESIGIKAYAGIVGILLLLVALLGIAGLIPTAFPTELFHASVGAFFAYLGFAQHDAEVVRQVVAGMGLLLVMGKGVIIFIPLVGVTHPCMGLSR